MTDYKEYAKQMRENAIKNEQGNIVCSPELWEEIASVIERAISPPCKVGAEIFGMFDNDDEQRKEIYEGKVLCYSLDENNLLWARMRYKNGLTYWHTIDDFGKTVFLTKEEAEAKLGELNSNEKF